MSYGGLSDYEQMKVLGQSKVSMPDSYRQDCLNIDEYRRKVEAHPDSLEWFWNSAGHTYKGWYSFMDYRPIDDYADINIPILFVHGEQDYLVPVESTRYIQENLPDKPFEYIYADCCDHVFGCDMGKNLFATDVKQWLINHHLSLRS
jgi:pimeloyl-ACP methyl ester carboxylesterase